MKIAYGIHGYGRGHAMRSLAVLPALAARHEVLVLAGGDAYDALRGEHVTLRVPTLKYHHRRPGRLSNYLNFKRNVSAVIDLLWEGPALDMVADILEEFRPDVAISDSEPFTLHAARRMRVPRISFDHFGLLVHCRPEMPRLDRLRIWGDRLVYRVLCGSPERIIVSGFFAAAARRSGVCVVGPVVREEVRAARPSRGEHLLVYLAQGAHQFTPNVERALLELDCPVRIYGTPRRGLQENLQFKPISNLAFIEDLAGCRAVIGTTGNQLLGEVIYFGKPMLGLPMQCVEQRLNAAQLERRGIGMQTTERRLNGDLIRRFLARESEFIAHFTKEFHDGAREALEAIERFITELAGSRAAPVDRDDRALRAIPTDPRPKGPDGSRF